MRTIPAALTWELFTRNRWQFLLMACGASVLPLLLYTALEYQGAIDPMEPGLMMMHVILIQINMFIFASGLMTAMGPMSRLYAYPARASTLVAWQLIPAMICMFVEMMASTAILNTMFDLRWPLWGPSLFAAVAMSGVMAVAWLTEKTFWLPIGTGLAAAGFGLWFKSRYGAVLDQLPTHYWDNFTLAEGVTLLILAVLSHQLAVYAVERNRCGETLPSLNVTAWLERQFDGPRVIPAGMLSPAAAQLWFEWHKKGWAMPGIVIIGLTFGAPIWLIFSRDPTDLVEALLLGGGAMMGCVGLVGGIVHGNCSTRDQDLVMSQFLATRPITTAQLGRIMLWNTAKGAATAIGLWATTAAVITVPLLLSGVVSAGTLDGELRETWWWWIPLASLSPWVFGAGLAAILLAGRGSLFAGVTLTLFALTILTNFLTSALLTADQQKFFWQVVLIAISVMIALGTASLFAIARRRELVDALTSWMSLTTWIALVVILVLAHVFIGHWPWQVVVCGIGALALVVAPLATTPLALAWNRTR